MCIYIYIYMFLEQMGYHTNFVYLFDTHAHAQECL